VTDVKASKEVHICKGDVVAEERLTQFMRLIHLKFKYLSCEG
jgi:hypothetical protein